MLNLPCPIRNASTDYVNASTRRNEPARTALLHASPIIDTAYADYLQRSDDLGQIMPIATTLELGDALRTNYDLWNSGDQGIRGELLAGAPHGKCPMCGYGEVATLDHFLPKSVFPEFSVFAPNLVPVCDICNRRKGNRYGPTADRQFLHAYFHALPHRQILLCRVLGTSPLALDYELVEHPDYDPQLLARAQYHFNRLRLRQRFTRLAVAEATERTDALENYYGGGDSAAVQTYLLRESNSVRRSFGINHWKTSLFAALASNQAFCQGGFL